jgi:hypothetical protein
MYSEFRHTSKNFEGGLPRHILEKNTVLWKKAVEIWAFDGIYTVQQNVKGLWGRCLSKFIDWRYSQCVALLPFFLVQLSTLPPSLCDKYTVYTYTLLYRVWFWVQTDKYLPQSLFTGQFFLDDDIFDILHCLLWVLSFYCLDDFCVLWAWYWCMLDSWCHGHWPISQTLL